MSFCSPSATSYSHFVGSIPIAVSEPVRYRTYSAETTNQSFSLRSLEVELFYQHRWPRNRRHLFVIEGIDR